MRLKIISWDGNAINDGTNYETMNPPGNAMPSAVANFVDMGQANPALAGKTLNGGYFTFLIVMRGDVEAQRDELNEWFQVDDYTYKHLLAYDLDNSNHEWYLEGFPITPPMLQDSSTTKYTVTLALKQPYWIENDENSTAWNITADTETQAVSNIGNVKALPIFEITPAVAKGSNTIRGRLFVGINHSNWETLPVDKTPIDLTPSGFNTSALVGSGDMNSSGNDIVVSVDGVSVYRWFYGMNTTSTHIWASIAFTHAPDLVLLTALDSSTTPASITCSFTETTISLPQNSTIQIGTEFISYSTVTIDNTNKRVTFIPSLRGAKGSTKASHSINDDVFWIEHDIWITYGNPSASAPTQPDSNKPSFDLATSSNSVFIWNDFSAMPTNYGASSPRFLGAAARFTEEDYATTGQADPYEVMGLQLESVLVGNIVQNLNVWGKVSITHQGGISRFICSAEKWRSGANFGNLSFITGNATDTITSPSVVDTWESISVDITPTVSSRIAQMIFSGVLGTTLPIPKARAQMFSATIYVDNPPNITVINQALPASVYQLGALIENETTDEGIQVLDLATYTDETTTIDCDDLEAYKEDGTRVRAKISITGDARDDWMTLAPGSNTIRYTDTGTNDVDVVIRWRARNTI